MRTTVILLSLLFLNLGCARYEFELVHPEDQARRIGRMPVYVERAPVAYEMQTFEQRLVIRIFNEQEETVQLLGAESFLVSPDGQSRPLPTMAIAPASYVQMVLPPPPPHVVRTGPTVGVGVGVGMGGRVRPGAGVHYPVRGGRAHVRTADHWDWRGERQVRMRLVYHLEGERSEHEFTFRRVRAR